MSNVKSRFDFPKEYVDEMLEPGLGPMEIGYKPLPNGDMIVSTYTRMPGCSGEMVNWWFGSYLTNTQSYKLWHSDHTTFRWNEAKKPGTPVGATHISEEVINGEIVPMEITFFESSDLYRKEDLEKAHIGCALIAEIHKPSGELYSMFLHIIRDFCWGCEMRNRFYMFGSDVDAAKGLMQHNVEEMGNLAEILPCLYFNHRDDKE